MNGKGSEPRKVNINKYNKNYDLIFNKMNLNKKIYLRNNNFKIYKM